MTLPDAIIWCLPEFLEITKNRDGVLKKVRYHLNTILPLFNALLIELLRFLSEEGEFDDYGRHSTLNIAEILVSEAIVWAHTKLFPGYNWWLVTAFVVAFIWLSGRA